MPQGIEGYLTADQHHSVTPDEFFDHTGSVHDPNSKRSPCHTPLTSELPVVESFILISYGAYGGVLIAVIHNLFVRNAEPATKQNYQSSRLIQVSLVPTLASISRKQDLGGISNVTWLTVSSPGSFKLLLWFLSANPPASLWPCWCCQLRSSLARCPARR